MIGYDERALAVGMTQSGKSTLLAWLFSELENRRALIDPKGEWSIAGVPRVRLTARTAAEAEDEVRRKIDPTAATIHAQPAWLGQPGSREQLDALYAHLDAIPGPLTVWTDEAYGVSSAAWAPGGLTSLQVAGAGRGHGHWPATQRPRNIDTTLKTEADHLLVFPPLSRHDYAEVLAHVPVLELAELEAIAGELPRYGFLWIDKRARRYDVGPPLPDYLRAAVARTLRRNSAP